MSGASNGGGPCGACKFLRRKCVKGCIFAPYFDADHGTTHFAAVHKVFGASNASKLLQRIPAHRRLDAVVTLCYEALSRVRDPVYGCVGHIFTLQQQVVNLQAELAFVQARLATLQRLPPLPVSSDHQPTGIPSRASLPPPSELASNSDLLAHLDQLQRQQLAPEPTCNIPVGDEPYDGDLQTLAREFVSWYLPGVRTKPPRSP